MNHIKQKQRDQRLVPKRYQNQNSTNLGLESLAARVEEALRVMAHKVSAALAWTSGGLCLISRKWSNELIQYM